MSFDKLESQIKSSTEEQVLKTKTDGDDRLKLIKADINNEADACSQFILDAGEYSSTIKASEILSHARLKARNKLEEAKKIILDDVMNEAEASILSLSKKEKKQVLENILCKAKPLVDNPSVLVDETCKGLIVGKPGNIGGFGFKVLGKNGSVTVDCRLKTLLNRLKELHEAELSVILFEGGK